MRYLFIARTAVLTLCIILGLPAFGLIAHWTQFTTSPPRPVALDFEKVGLLAGTLSVIIWPVMLILPIFRKNVYFLNIIFELSALLVFWILWMTTAILVIQWTPIFYPLGDCSLLNPVATTYCNEFFAIQGLTITVFLIILLYLIALLIFALVSHSRQKPVWMLCVTDLDANNATPADQNNFTMDPYSPGQSAPSTYQPPMTSNHTGASTTLPNQSTTGVTTPLFQQPTSQTPNLPQV